MEVTEIERREHEANVWRLKSVLGLGLLLWNVIGIPNDVQVTKTFGLSYREFTVARVISTGMLVLGYLGLFTRPSPRALRFYEGFLFVGTAGGLAGLHHGPAGPTPIFLSCTLLAQGIAVPRPWRAGLRMLGATWLAYPIGFAITELATGRSRAFAGPGVWSALAYSLLLAATTGVFLVWGGDAFWALRRRALEAQRVGRYRLRRRLGHGGLGEVWLAEHPGLGQPVALKLARPGGETRLAQEIEILAALSHPCTVRLVDRGRTEEGRLYAALEYLSGRTLEDVVAEHGPRTPERVVRIGLQLARALAEAHGRGIVHCDVKPSNVLVLELAGERDRVKLIDFGAAQHVGGGTPLPEGLVGSTAYMAPEQRERARPDPRADVFALGATLYFALTGSSPLATEAGPSLRALPTALDRLPEEVPAELRAVLGRCLARMPEDRPDDARAVEAELLALLA